MGDGLRTRWVVAVVMGGGLAVSACSKRQDTAARDSAMATSGTMDSTRNAGSDAAGAAGASGAPAKPEGAMQAVLDELGTLGPKPLETLTPAEARKQPTPKDAVV